MRAAFLFAEIAERRKSWPEMQVTRVMPAMLEQSER